MIMILGMGLVLIALLAVVVGWQLLIPFVYKKMGWAMPGTQVASTQPVTPSQATAPSTRARIAADGSPARLSASFSYSIRGTSR